MLNVVEDTKESDSGESRTLEVMVSAAAGLVRHDGSRDVIEQRVWRFGRRKALAGLIATIPLPVRPHAASMFFRDIPKIIFPAHVDFTNKQ